MIVTTNFENMPDEYRNWFRQIEDEGLTSDEMFDPSNAFSFFDSSGIDSEWPYTISGSIWGINPDGSLTKSLVLLTDDGPQAASNLDLGVMLSAAFPNIYMDPESDCFFAYAKTREDAELLTGLLNHPEKLGDLIDSL